GEAAAEQPCRPLDRQPFGDVDELAAAVIALPRQALGVFVGEDRPLRLEDGAADDVLRGDQLDLVTLAPQFAENGVGDLGIAFRQRGAEKTLGRDRCTLRDRHSLLLARTTLSAGRLNARR